MHVPFIPAIGSGSQIMGSFRLGHGTPDLFSMRVAGFVVELGADDEDDIVGYEREKDFVAGAVQGFVGVAVDLYVGGSFSKGLLYLHRWRGRYVVALCWGLERLTLDEITFEAWTHILYSADPTARVRTEPALRLVIATVPYQLLHY